MGRIEGEGVMWLAIQDGGDESAQACMRTGLDEGPNSIAMHPLDEFVEEDRTGQLACQECLGFRLVGGVRLAGAVGVDGDGALVWMDVLEGLR